MTAALRSGVSAPRDEIATLAWSEFRARVAEGTQHGRRVVSLFARKRRDGRMQLVAVLAGDHDGSVEMATTLVENAYPSMTLDCPQVHLFEREIAERWRIVPEGHPWLKPVRSGGVADFYRVEGEEVHEVAVGPVHAGVIEPGHFRFQCHGERVFHLEIALGYQHRGVERALEGGPTKRTLPYMETLAGDTTIGHTLAYCETIESLAAVRVPARAQSLRGIALELERLANHVGGLGALAGDVGFLPTSSFCGRLRGDFLNMTAAICGSRFGRGLVRPGGVAFDVDDALRADLRRRLAAALRDVRDSVELMWNSASVQARFEGTGAVSTAVAETFGFVGVAARACGLERDARQDHPSGVYRMAHIPVSVWQSGDVFSRAYVRWLEIQRSGAFVDEQLDALPRGKIRTAFPAALPPGRASVGLVEGWRGEICHVAMTDDAGKLATYKVVDPSFHNWIGLAMALRDQAISDFPLCNKSFDLSYCGHDL